MLIIAAAVSSIDLLVVSIIGQPIDVKIFFAFSISFVTSSRFVYSSFFMLRPSPIDLFVLISTRFLGVVI